MTWKSDKLINMIFLEIVSFELQTPFFILERSRVIKIILGTNIPHSFTPIYGVGSRCVYTYPSGKKKCAHIYYNDTSPHGDNDCIALKFATRCT